MGLSGVAVSLMSEKSPLPGFGRAIRSSWGIDWQRLTVNHGSYGATPLPVLAAQDDWRARMEAQPTIFMQTVLPSALRDAAQTLAAFLGAQSQDLAFIDNATTGANAVLNSLDWQAGDEIVLTSHGYNAVKQTVLHLGRRFGVTIVEADIPFPQPDDAIIVANIARAVGPRTKLVIVDHITSPSALILPVAAIIAAVRERGVPVLVDGAHGPALLPIDLTALDADWYTGNCHKWLMAPKGSAFLWVNPRRSEVLHPTVISHGYDQGFIAEFDWTGTRDPSAYLSVPAAIDFHRAHGGPELMARNARLGWDAADYLAGRFGTTLAAAPHQQAAMVLVGLPITGAVDKDRMLALRERIMALGCDAAVNALANQGWLRISAAAYNDMDDFEQLGDLLLRECRTA